MSDKSLTKYQQIVQNMTKGVLYVPSAHRVFANEMRIVREVVEIFFVLPEHCHGIVIHVVIRRNHNLEFRIFLDVFHRR